jgi:hypothetical protein
MQCAYALFYSIKHKYARINLCIFEMDYDMANNNVYEVLR